MKLYLDECGATGPDLNNASAPTFVLASNTLTPVMSRKIHSELFFDITGELKHAELKRSHPDRVVQFIRKLHEFPNRAAFYVANKPFALLIKLVDFWVASAWEEHGLSFYLDGQNVAFANACFFEMQTSSQRREFYGLMDLFQRMLRQYGQQNYTSFWTEARKYAKIHPNHHGMKEILAAEEVLGPNYYRSLCRGRRDLSALSIHFTCLLSLFAFWQQKHPYAKFELLHDESSEMKQQKRHWDNLSAPAKSRIAYGYDSQVRYPLKISSTSFDIRSSDYLQIQYSDLLAGAAAEVLNSHEPYFRTTKYVHDLIEAGIVDFAAGGILPIGLSAIQDYLERRNRRMQYIQFSWDNTLVHPPES